MATDLPEKPLNREEAYLADIAGQEVVLPEKPESRKEQYLAYIAENGGGGGGGTNNFNQLTNRPKYNSTTMTGNTNIPKVPTKTSELSNDSNFVTSGSLATVATTGAYSDLSGTPTIPVVNNATLTVTQNGTSVGTFTANSSTDTTIAVTDTTYSNFTGTDGTSAGAAGLVPAPATTDAGKFLKADGTWDTAGGGGPTVVQTTGTSTTDVMSQNAVTSMVYAGADSSKIKIGKDYSTYSFGSNSVNIGSDARTGGQGGVCIGASAEGGNYSNSTCIGSNASTGANSAVAIGYRSQASNGSYPVAIGYSAKADSGWRTLAIGSEAHAAAEGSIALGANSSASTQGEMNIGTSFTSSGYNNSNYRLISGVYDPQTAHDAATKGYVDGKVLSNAGAPTTATEGTVGQLLEDTTNGKLYQCTAVTPGTDPDPDTYTWTEVGSGGGGGTGAVIELTTADYDYTQGTTTGVALWRLNAGLYHTGNDVQAFAGSDSSFKLSLNSHLIIIDDSGNQKLIKVVGDDFTAASSGIYKGFVQYKVAASDGSGIFTQSESVVSTASLMIVRSAAPTSSDVGFRGQLWFDSTNNKLYVNVNRPNDYAGNWKEITLA